MPFKRNNPGCGCCETSDQPGCCQDTNFGTFLWLHDPDGPHILGLALPNQPRDFRMRFNGLSSCVGGWGLSTTDAFANSWRATMCLVPRLEGCYLTFEYRAIGAWAFTGDVYNFAGYASSVVCGPLSMTFDFPAYSGPAFNFSARAVVINQTA